MISTITFLSMAIRYTILGVIIFKVTYAKMMLVRSNYKDYLSHPKFS